jgi:hypothetical protein
VERKRRRSLEGRELGEDLRHLDVVVVDRICFSIADLQLLLLLLLKNSNFLTAELAIPTASINCSFLLALMIWVFFRLLSPLDMVGGSKELQIRVSTLCVSKD